jgi:hypothetical protein
MTEASRGETAPVARKMLPPFWFLGLLVVEFACDRWVPGVRWGAA